MMHAPQIIWCCLASITLFQAMVHFGETKEPDTYDGLDLIGPFLGAALLWWGGFFS